MRRSNGKESVDIMRTAFQLENAVISDYIFSVIKKAVEIRIKECSEEETDITNKCTTKINPIQLDFNTEEQSPLTKRNPSLVRGLENSCIVDLLTGEKTLQAKRFRNELPDPTLALSSPKTPVVRLEPRLSSRSRNVNRVLTLRESPSQKNQFIDIRVKEISNANVETNETTSYNTRSSLRLRKSPTSVKNASFSVIPTPDFGDTEMYTPGRKRKQYVRKSSTQLPIVPAPPKKRKTVIKKKRKKKSRTRIASIAWTKEEDDFLRVSVKKPGQLNWADIASSLETRTISQCSQRWKRVLQPKEQILASGSLKAWTEEEDDILFGVECSKFTSNRKWTKAARLIPNRCDIQIKYRFETEGERRAENKRVEKGKRPRERN